MDVDLVLSPTLIRVVYGEPKELNKIAMFDLDGTLIQTASGKKFPIDKFDWKWRYDSVPNKLRELNNDGFSLYIITNQAGVASKRSSAADIIEKIQKILSELDLPITVFIATAKDVWRKPNTFIIEKYILPSGDKVRSLERIFYVGDAAGRDGDFSDSDRKFAYNIYLYMRFLVADDLKKSQYPAFYTEKYLDQSKPYVKPEGLEWKGVDPSQYMKPTQFPMDKIPEKDFVLIMIGPPGSGKSTLAKRISEARSNVVIINQDELKTKQACLKAFKEALQNGASVILDRTNPSPEDRKEFLALAHDREILYIHMTIPIEFAKHMIIVRERMRFGQYGQTNSLHIPKLVFAQYAKKLSLPTSGSIEVPFSAHLTSARHKLYFLQKTASD
jgi:bifunctional polynucleotide phosphatase/kinase